MTLRSKVLLAFAVLVVGSVTLYASLIYFTTVPGTPHIGPLPPLTAEERNLADALRRHVEVIAAREHNLDHPEELEKVALYIESVLGDYGYVVNRHGYEVDKKPVRNIEATIEPSAAATDPAVIVVGAHYDSARGTPGANDNATGTASVLELARMLSGLRGTTDKRIRLVLFVNEEPPYFYTTQMGSWHYAAMLSTRKERVIAMYSLETLGFYSDEPGSQSYPPPLGLIYSQPGNFVSFVGMLNSRPLVQESIKSFREHTKFPTIGGAAPGYIPGITWSDHWSFSNHGFQALMITDTATFRYPHYHEPTDTPDKVNFESHARVTKGIERVIRDAAKR
ncbi:aminopeptidase YwaD precursor [Variibacter gotjawalensis]|uniref:Aminopeptidase YwaD n=1 Tax=Variibacter gotjawalensis TaxID=1333996 RepID=A0A0S3PY83_9BRAD|nr:M28 family peptidase [Variibacter gotjawalensis]NIK46686.1 hypothetical protein [Variibacter gotjawalensis]RZS48589.1 peptidase M28-like protein [Variibacter gotjawalensis]BAT60851.1 aminopeptidase YwaD precursor [Variibacter gotjawalensis]